MKISGSNILKVVTVVVSVFIGSSAYAAPRLPQPPLPEFVPTIFSERFDEFYTKDSKDTEIAVKEVGVLRESWSGYALERSGKTMPFVISGVDEKGRTNVMCQTGAVRLWVKPYWSSASTGIGKGPGHVAQVMELSLVGKEQVAAIWSLQISVDGSVIYLVGAGEKESGVLLKAEIAWQAGEWHQVILNYGEKGTELVLDGEFVAEGAGTVSLPPKLSALTVGSSLSGLESLEGEIDEVYCFIRPLRMAFHYQAFKEIAARGAISAEEMAYRTELSEKRKAAMALKDKENEESGNYGGGMMLRMAGPANNCVTNGPVYLTNVVCNFMTNEGWTLMFDIAGGTNGVVYDLFSTPELKGSNTVWTWLETGKMCETHYFTNQATNQMFYTILTPGTDRDQDGMYDGWEWKHFGTLAQAAGEDFDGDGVSNGISHAGDNDPNQIKFTVGFGSGYVNGSTATGNVMVTQGVPDHMAVLVNSTNFGSAVWIPFQSTIVANIGNTDGEYPVWVGLRGHSWDTRREWQGTTLVRDTVAPVVTITNPGGSTTSKPVLQLQGLANEPLLSVHYDITNASGLETNVTGYVTQQYLNTNTLQFTTNWFQCYDVELATNLNTITVRVSDMAGNMTATNFNLTLDYSGDTNAPTIAVTWPDENALVSGTSFTLRGQLDDGSASVSVVVESNTIAGTVDRNGNFEVPGIPISQATNTLTVIATDAAGNNQTAVRTVRQSTETLTIDPISPSQLTQPTVTLSGTVGTSGGNVWVNGVAATVTGNSWTVIVATPQGGVANFDAQTGSVFTFPTATHNLSARTTPEVRPFSFLEKKDTVIIDTQPAGCDSASEQAKWIRSWNSGVGGSSVFDYQKSSIWFGNVTCQSAVEWPPEWPGNQIFLANNVCPWVGGGQSGPAVWHNKNSSTYSAGAYFHADCSGIVTWDYTFQRYAETKVELRVGGARQSGRLQLIRLTARAAKYSEHWSDRYAEASVGDVPLPVSSIRILEQSMTPTATNATVGELFVTMPEGSINELPFNVIGTNDYSFDVKAEEVKLDILEVISDQIATNECNKLPTAVFPHPNNPMLMATRSGVDTRLAVKMDFQTNLLGKVMVGVREVGTKAVLGSTIATNAPAKTYLAFNANTGLFSGLGDGVYEVVAGVDGNANGILDKSEAAVVFAKTPKGTATAAQLTQRDKIIVVTPSRVTAAKIALYFGGNIGGTGYAGDILEAFVLGATNVATATTTFGVPLDSTHPSLSHPVGALWNAACQTTTVRFTFPDGVQASNDFEASQALLNIISNTVTANLSSLLASGTSTFTNSSSLPFSIFIDFGATETAFGFNKLKDAFGRVTVNGSLQVTYRKTGATSIEVSDVNVSGSFDDLYDFDYHAGTLSLWGSLIQAGHATISTPPSGKIFFTRLEFNTGWKTHQKNYP